MTKQSRNRQGGTRKPSSSTQAARDRLEFSNDLEDTRLFIQLMGTLIHRVDMGRRQLYDNDLDMACVAGTVALEGTEANLRLPEYREKYRSLNVVIGIDGQRGVNAFSIAQYTGIPRETVRRKLKRLAEKGAVVEKTRGAYVIKPGFPQKPESVAIIQEAMRYTLQFMNDCLAMGLVKVVDR